MESITPGGDFTSKASNVQSNDVAFAYSMNYNHSGCLWQKHLQEGWCTWFCIAHNVVSHAI